MAEWLTKSSIWLVIACYGIAIGAAAKPGIARGFWLAGLVAYLGHSLLAFAVYYGWSWSAAWIATADDAERLSGVRAGWGLWLNIGFGVAWSLLTIRAWSTRGAKGHGRGDGSGDACREVEPAWPKWLVRSLQAYLLFMVIQGGVVFAPMAARVFTVAVLICTALALLVSVRGRRPAPDNIGQA